MASDFLLTNNSIPSLSSAERLASDGITSPLPLSAIGQCLTESLILYIESLGGYKNIHVKSELAREIITDSKIRSLFYELFGSGYNLWRSNCFHRSPNNLNSHSGVPMHHDKHFQNGDSLVDFDELGDHVSIIIALDDINSSNGLFSYIPNSMIPIDSYKRDSRPYHKRLNSEHFLELPKRLILQTKLMAIPRNHFCLFHSGLLHGSIQSQNPEHAAHISLVGRVAKKTCEVPSELAVKSEIIRFC